MRTAIATLAAGAAMLAGAGCGSSSQPSAGTSAANTGTATTSSGAAGTTGSGATGSGAGGKPASSSSPGATLKGDTTPKFAVPSPSEPVRSGLVQIAYRDITIQPDTVRVKLGTRIRWTNHDSTKANVTSEGGPQKFASGNFGEGGTFEITASRPGVIHYECTLYPVTMNGTIEVLS